MRRKDKFEQLGWKHGLHFTGGGGGGRSTTVQQADPWVGQQPYLTDIFRQAQALHRTPGPQYFPQSTVAEFTPAQRQAQQQAAQFAQGQGQQLATDAVGANQFALGPVLYPQSNPALQGYIDAATRPIRQQFTEEIMPSIASGAVGNNAFGGSRQAIAEGLAADRAMRAVGDTAATVANEGYQAGLDTFAKGLALAPQTFQGGLAPATTVGAVGEQQRSMNQALIDDAFARFSFQQNLPYAKLNEYANMVSGNYGGTSLAQTTGGGPSLGNQLLSGAAGAMMGYSAFAPGGMLAATAINPMVGAGLGLLTAFL